jgi:hypothetical protein
MVCESWWAPDRIGYHDLWKEQWGGVPSFIKEHKSAISLKTCLVWKIVRTPLPVVDKNNHLPKQIFISVL